jgi:hypothetical protein
VVRKEDSCANKPHRFYTDWTGEECDHNSEGVNSNCCKCRTECCGKCTVMTDPNDPYQACSNPAITSRIYHYNNYDRPTSLVISSDQEPMVLAVIAGFGILVCCFSFLFCLRRARTRQDRANNDDKTKNLRDYRDDGLETEGSFETNRPLSREMYVIISNVYIMVFVLRHP